jgi:hypothetical protein
MPFGSDQKCDTLNDISRPNVASVIIHDIYSFDCFLNI